MNPKHLNQKDPWMLAEDIPDSDIFFFQIPFSCFNTDSSYDFVKKYTKIIASFDRFRMLFYFGEKDSFEVGNSILQALIERNDFGENINKNIEKWSHKLIDFAKHVEQLPISTLSERELWNLYQKHDEIHTKLYTYGWLPVAVDMFHNNFTDYLKNYISSLHKNSEEIEKFFVTLTTPTETSILNQEQDEFFDIYLKNKSFFKNYTEGSDIPKDIDNKIRQHADKWGHLGYIYVGDTSPFGREHYLKEFIDMAMSDVDVKTLKNKLVEDQEKTKTEQERINSLLKVDGKHRNLFHIARKFALTKLIRRHAQLLDLCIMHKYLLSEISIRIDITRFQVQFMLKNEVQSALLEGKLDKEEIAERLKSCVYYTERGFEKVYIGKEAEKLKNQLVVVIDENIDELQGQPACPGVVKGLVKIIIRAKDMNKMKEGDILVSIATDPDIVPAMKKASAIVTEQGGITSHAAIVSRELGIPCVIGTKIATKVFKDGDMVEVDAERGTVTKIKKGDE